MSISLLDTVAAHILEQYRSLLPDWRRLTILIPNYSAATALSRALSRATGGQTLLLPRLITLTDLCQQVAPGPACQTDLERISVLYDALRQHNWFADGDLWSICRELLSLIDELTLYNTPLPAHEQDFSEQLAAIYQSRNHQSLQFEAHIIHELWLAFQQNQDLCPTRRYQLQLTTLAQHLHHPLIILTNQDPDPAEQQFYQLCRQRTEVTCFDLRTLGSAHHDNRLLHAALNQNTDTPLLDLAADLPDVAALNRPERQLTLLGCNSLEQLAQCAEQQIRRWLLQSCQSIGVVIFDRMAARRTRALLERAQILVQDETGWIFSTVSVSTILVNWLDILQNDGYYQDLQDLMQSRFTPLSGGDVNNRLLLQKLIQQTELRQGLTQFLRAAQSRQPDLVPALAQLQQAAERINLQHSASLSQWLHQLQQSLSPIGVIQAWSQDPAGQQLLQLLNQWQQALTADEVHYDFSEFRHWLQQQLELNTFRDQSISSPVIFTHLSATRWRQFDAVLLLGCDSRHLPAVTQSGQWFNSAVRHSLGLPTTQTLKQQIKDDFLSLLYLSRSTAAVWQQNIEGEPNLISPYLQLIQALHQAAFNDTLQQPVEAGELDRHQIQHSHRPPCPPDQFTAAATVPAHLLPANLSPTAYNSLMICPYQFYARYILELRPADEVRDAIDKRDYGTCVHLILQQFHQQYPECTPHPRETLEHALLQISQQVFEQTDVQSFINHAWLQRWAGHIPGYIQWQLQQEQQGLFYDCAEKPFSLPVSPSLTLSGQVDRVDTNTQDGSQRVLDYKTHSASQARNKLKRPGEDVQLPCYAAAFQCEQAAFVPLDDDKIQCVTTSEEMTQLGQDVLERLAAIFQQLAQQQSLPANGIESQCQYCDYQGLCRQRYMRA